MAKGKAVYRQLIDLLPGQVVIIRCNDKDSKVGVVVVSINVGAFVFMETVTGLDLSEFAIIGTE